MTEPPSADRARVPRLWTGFVLGWMLVLAVVAWRLPGAGLEPYRLAGGLTCVALLAALFLWLTLRESLTTSDLTASGPAPSRVRRRAAVLVVMAALVIVLAVVVPGIKIWWLMMHPVVAAGLALPPALGAAATSLLLATALGAAWLIDGHLDAMMLLQVTFGAGAIAIRQLTTTVAQLRNAREELARSAVSEERLRFARDLHDLLGHSLSMIVLKSELAGRLAPHASHQAATEMADVERTAREALRQVRAAVAGYRRPSLGAELGAARELLRAAGIVAHIDEPTAPLPAAVDGLLGWAVREGVTNVIRHSGAQSCTIRLGRDAERATAEIADDGSGNAGGNGSTGSGLAGLAERAADLGGCVEIGRYATGGFRLLITAPLSGHAGGRG